MAHYELRALLAAFWICGSKKPVTVGGALEIANDSLAWYVFNSVLCSVFNAGL